MRIVLLGPPASGKGTQRRRLSASLGLGYLSTGALLRDNIEHGTPLGLAASPILARGGNLSDELMCPIPVIDFYRSSGRPIPVPATGTKDETAATIFSSLRFKI